MSTLTQVANDKHDASPWLLFMELGIPTVPTVRIVSNNENIDWRGFTWQALGLGKIDIEVAKGEIPNITITVPNARHIITQYLNDYNSYIIQNGVEGNEIDVSFFVVPYKLIQQNPNCEEAFSVTTQYLNSDFNNANAVLTVGAYNIFSMYFPNLIIGPSCNWEFKGAICGYSGVEAKCNRTLKRCKELGNSSRFGGHPGVMPLGVQIAAY